MRTISHDHAKLDSDTIAYTIRPLVEANPSLKANSIIAETWLAKKKSVTKFFDDWKVSYQTLPVWLKAMGAKMPRSRVEIKTLPIYHESDDWCKSSPSGILELLFVYVVTRDGVGIISYHHNSIDAAIARSNGAWSPPRVWHMFCIRYIESNSLRMFKALYLHKLMAILVWSRSTTKTTKDLKSRVRHILDGAIRSVLRNRCWHLTEVIVGVI
ncbi:hypothetical protein Ahy_B05g079419 isoform A [Arachis hypogaea]|uniref:Uncharacterized protein n=1 Tax=Arachis hypogaea TaxID=3818 RepID=A0A444Z9S9_ARAHY|nr:hypothetical protein Ahy_B05g079419 isoform A [Arachis hypogaea]